MLNYKNSVECPGTAESGCKANNLTRYTEIYHLIKAIFPIHVSNRSRARMQKKKHSKEKIHVIYQIFLKNSDDILVGLGL